MPAKQHANYLHGWFALNWASVTPGDSCRLQCLSQGLLWDPATCLLRSHQTSVCRAEQTRLLQTLHCVMVRGGSAREASHQQLQAPLHNR